MKLRLVRNFILCLLVLGMLIFVDLTQFSWNWSMLMILIPNFRLPRLLALIIAGIAIAAAGFIIQGATENPLADGGTMGVTSGASFGAVLFVLLSTRLKLPDFLNFTYPLFAIFGALFAFGLIYFCAIRRGLSNVKVLLTGIAVTAFFQALITISQLLINSFDFQQVAVWLSGDVWQTKWSVLAILSFVLLFLLLVSSRFFRRMDGLALGMNEAQSLGLSIERTKLKLYLLALAFAVVAVSLVGGLGFVGLIAPHIARRLANFKARNRFAFSLLLGVIILVFSDIIGQLIISPSSLPLGFIVAFIGAPYYIYIIQKEL